MYVNPQKEFYQAWVSQTNFLAKVGLLKKRPTSRITDLIFKYGDYPAQVRMGAKMVRLREGWVRRMLAAYKKAIERGEDTAGHGPENRLVGMSAWFRSCEKKGVPITLSMESYQFHARRMKRMEAELPEGIKNEAQG